MKGAFLSAVLCFILLPVPSYASTTDDAVKAMQKGDFKTALKELRPLAKKNDPNAEFLMGMLYDAGKGVPQDQAIAASWYRKAAEQNHLVAQLFLGIFYYSGTGVKQDYKEAARWLRPPAEKGNDQAQFYLGRMYQAGNGVKKDSSRAIEWFRKAAAQKNTRAMGMLASMLFSRKRDGNDLIEAYVWSHLAAEYDPVQAGTAESGVIEEYCDDAQKNAAKKLMSAWKKKWASQPNSN